MSFCLSDKVKETAEQVLILSLYTISIPLYMMAFTYLLTLYQGRVSFMQWELMPLFLGTVWIPAFCGLFVNDLLRQRKNKNLKKGEKLKDYPFVFITLFSIYFLILGLISFGSDCLTIALSGLLLGAFSFLLKPIRRCVEYLPATENFYFYVVLFLFPILVLMATDISLSLQDGTGFSILLAPISYIPGISGLMMICLCVRYWCLYRHISLKKYLLTMDQVVGILLVCDVFATLYMIPFLGPRLFIVCFIMAFCLYFVELIFKWARVMRRKSVKQNS